MSRNCLACKEGCDNCTLAELLPCPFCGAVPEIRRQGNAFTKNRRVVIRCPSCRIERADAAIRHDMDWVERIAVKNWNMRPDSQP